MLEQAKYIRELLVLHMNGTISPEQEEELFDLLGNYNNDEISDIVEPLIAGRAPDPGFELKDWEETIRYIVQHPSTHKVKHRKMWRRWVAAASIIAITAGLWWVNRDGGFMQVKTSDFNPEQNDVSAPESNRARITLADGTTLFLDSAGTGQLAVQGGVKLVKKGDGEIVYSSLAGTLDDGSEISYNTLSNPRGSKVIDLKLSDGSQVWLNAGSSVTYPVTFSADDRKVSITGEAYFEVVHNASRPFYVSAGKTEVKVLGTKFNINAYDDEPDCRVTLLQGSVQVSANNDKDAKLLKPGEGAVVKKNGSILVSGGINTEAVMAWKNGRFEFDNSTVDEVMKEISRWYDVDVEYRGAKPEIHFMGGISRMENVSEVLKMLEQTKAIHFSIRERKIQVMKG